MATIRTRADRIRTNNVDDFFSFTSSILSDVSRKMEGGFRDERDRQQTIDLLRQTRLNVSRVRNRISDDQFSTLDAALESLTSALEDRVDETRDATEADTDQGQFKIQEGLGPPRYHIDAEKLQELLRRGFTVTAIAREGLLGPKVHRNTIVNFMKRNNIQHPKAEYSIPDGELEEKVRDYVVSHPNAGYEEVRAYLRTSQPPVFVARARVRDMVASIDPEGVASRWSAVAQRRTYSVKSPNSLWHIDGHHSLVRYGLYVHGAIDGYSRLIPYLKCSPFNTAQAAFTSFVTGVQNYSIPSRVRMDEGVENGLIRDFMVEANGPDRGSAMMGKSVHNQRIERLWRDVFAKVVQPYYQAFHALEESRALDPSNKLQIYCLQHVFLPLINADLERWRVTHNNQGVRTEGHRTPEQLWISGILSQRSSSGTALMNVRADRDILDIAHRVCPTVDLAAISDPVVLHSPRPYLPVTDDIRRELLSSVEGSPSLESGLERYAVTLQFIAGRL